jgi:hypothetical protein
VIIATVDKVERNTAPELNEKFESQLKDYVTKYIGVDRHTIDMRLQELEKEWNVERMIEVEAPSMIGLGIGLGLMHDKRWFALSAMAASMVILHNLQGWYPMLPLFRRMGLRSQSEIDREYMALRVLRGDNEAFERHSVH